MPPAPGFRLQSPRPDPRSSLGVDAPPQETRSIAARSVAAAPHLLLALSFALALLAFLRQGYRLTDELRTFAMWPLHEFLASCFGCLLPLAVLLGDLALRLRGGIASRGRRTLVTALFLLPFLALAVASSPAGQGWMTLVFLAFALAHWTAFEASAPPSGENARALLRALGAFGRCYGIAILAMLLASFTVVLPMDAWVGHLPDDPRLEFLLVAVGVHYHLLMAISHLVDLDGILDRRIARMRWERAADLAWALRPPAAALEVTPPPAPARPRRELADPAACPELVGGEEPASRQWLAVLPLSRAARGQVQLWLRGVVRFGTSIERRRLERRAAAGFGVAALLGGMLLAVIALHPASFVKKYRERRPSPHPRIQQGSEAGDRGIAGGMAVLAFLGGIGGLGAAFALRRRLPRARVTIDVARGQVRTAEGLVLAVAEMRLVASAAASPGASAAVFQLAAQAGERQVVLLQQARRCDVEMVGHLLLPCGFRELALVGGQVVTAPVAVAPRRCAEPVAVS